MTFVFSISKLAVICFFALSTLVEARCHSPEVRREWRALSKLEQKQYIDALKCMSKLPHDPALTPTIARNISQIPPIDNSSSLWDDFVYIHMDLNTIIHFTGYFLPWHRLYIQGLETAMKEKCNFNGTQPYWDWTKDSADIEHSDMFDPSPVTGLGGWGDPKQDNQITTGALANIIRRYPVPHHIRRNFTLQPWKGLASPFPDNQTFVDPEATINSTVTPENIDYMINAFAGDFLGFQAYMEGSLGPHAAIHLGISADMVGQCPSNTGPPDCISGAKWTPNDPFFFFHHAMIDKVWSDWQNKREENFWSFTGGSIATLGTTGNVTYAQYSEFPNGLPPMRNFSSILPGDGMFPDRKIWEVMDTLDGPLCYIYE